jgi:hypothetical protein
MQLDIEKLHSLESIVNLLIAEGVDTLKPVTRYMSGSLNGSVYQVSGDTLVAHPLVMQALEYNLSVIDTAIDYILNNVSCRKGFDHAVSLYCQEVGAKLEHDSATKNPIGMGHIYFAAAFGNNSYDIDRFNFSKETLVFQGLSNLLRDNYRFALRDLVTRKVATQSFFAGSQVLSITALDFSTFKQKCLTDLSTLYDRYGWRSATKFELDAEKTYCGICPDSSSNYLTAKINRDDLLSLFNANIMSSDLKCNNKKVIVGAVEAVDHSEVEAAAKKIKTVTDINGLKMYRVTSGILLTHSQEINDYWGFQRKDKEQAMKLIDSLEGYYIAVMDTPENSFKTVGSSLGRTISSCSKQLTNKVMSSLDLDDLI